MAAIITDRFRKNNTARFIGDVLTPGSPITSYHIGIGKSDYWSLEEAQINFGAPIPSGSVIERKDVLDNLQALAAISEAVRLAPKNRWYKFREYKTYDPSDSSSMEQTGNTWPCYVSDGSDNVYVCLSRPMAKTSTAPPTPNASGSIFMTLDNYMWVQIGKKHDHNKFTESPNFFTPEPTTATKLEGVITGFKIEVPGTGLESIPPSGNTITVIAEYGNETESKTIIFTDSDFTLESDGTGLGNVIMNPAGITKTDNLHISRVSISGYSIGTLEDSVIVPVVTPFEGINDDILDLLPTYFVGLAGEFSGDEESEISDDISYRQISVIKDPDHGTLGAPDDIITALRSFTVSEVGGIADSKPGDIITFNNGAKIFFDYYDSDEDKVFYHQNSSNRINRINPANIAGGQIIDSPSGVTINPGSYGSSEYTPDTGEVIFIENRKPITRTTNQVDNIRLVIQM